VSAAVALQQRDARGFSSVVPRSGGSGGAQQRVLRGAAGARQ